MDIHISISSIWTISLLEIFPHRPIIPIILHTYIPFIWPLYFQSYFQVNVEYSIYLLFVCLFIIYLSPLDVQNYRSKLKLLFFFVRFAQNTFFSINCCSFMFFPILSWSFWLATSQPSLTPRSSEIPQQKPMTDYLGHFGRSLLNSKEPHWSLGKADSK